MRNQRDKRNYIIIGLCAILVIMGVGYASFSTLLTINGTANISNSWCLGFDNTKTNTMQVTKGVSTGANPTGSMSYSGTACSTTLQPNASLSATFHQPGDEIEYTLTIKNASTVTAAIKSILVDNESVTSNTTRTKDNITYVINMPLDTTLSANEETTMTIIAKVQNETPISGVYTGETKTINVKINAEQDDGNGGFTPTPAAYSGDVYAWNTTGITVGTSTINDLASTKTAQPYYTSSSDLVNASGYTFFNKYTVVNNTITEGYACQTFGISGFEPVCLKMSTDGSTFGDNNTGNRGILTALSTNSAFTGAGGECSFYSDTVDCYVGRLYLDADDTGTVYNGINRPQAYCKVYNDNYAICH